MLNEQRLFECFPFDTYRAHQKEVLEQCIEAFDSGKKHVAILGPTGFGKSAVAIALSKYYGSGYVGTTQKSLQKQYCYDFNLQELYGKSNYDCLVNFGLKCDNPICKKDKCYNCPYITARNKCLDANIAVMNYSLLFSLKMYSNLIEKRPIAVYDEAHVCEDALIDFIGLNISPKTFKQYNVAMILPPSDNASNVDVIKWLVEKMKPHLESTMNSLSIALEGYIPESDKIEFGKQYAFIDKFVCQINRMVEFIRNNGKICTQVNNGTVSIKPLLVDKFAKPFIESIGERNVYLSATLQSKELFCKCLGIPESELVYISLGSVFPPENRPIYYVPIGKMSYKEKATTLPKMSVVVDKILSSSLHSKQRGIIHTSTYDIANYIYDNSEHQDRLVFPKNTDKAQVLTEFFESDRDDLVLISPSLMEGIDLKGDLCEFSIVCKLPFASLADNWVKEKMNTVDGWYTEQTLCKLIQSTGRHIRSETEIGVTYILDETFAWFYNTNKFRFPKWWLESLKMR